MSVFSGQRFAVRGLIGFRASFRLAVSLRMAELTADGLGELDFSAVVKPYLPNA